MTHSTTTPTKAEQSRLDAISKLPCMCCVVLGVRQLSRTEIHHLVDKGTRELSGGHMATIPLCAWHHRGMPGARRRPSEMLATFGPSLALQKKAFVSAFGTERMLLARLDALLKHLTKARA